MIDRYMQLKKKGLIPDVSMVENQPGEFTIDGETRHIRLTLILYDPDTGQVERTQVLQRGISSFVAEGKAARQRWLAFKEIYEALAGEGFPND